mmetsp:Transcript_30350/g.66439  ORF Transcript_30350/g.66439 Transcript_30350/m.66439 type:complete len:101 (+) Transcript_30350:53-355(+)|eukprot:CAMPEP_0170596166 /NCGR_PEP_ID=MMETSP0224-20130122/14961_1 /TAXON_ID=285029 /ORGANISM="Togula jolla, Strain CCCM 725" /LENGTH=100 /DNA_ID=CAMNT_0010920417 /DNA_START=47 /DNA_END=349 /DNA_ORIENTATION=-
MAAGAGDKSSGSAGSSGRAPAASVGGQRQNQLARRPGRTGAVATNSGRKAAGGGILNFYTDDAPGLKVGPTTVLVMSLAFMALVCFLHIMGKFRSGVGAS